MTETVDNAATELNFDAFTNTRGDSSPDLRMMREVLHLCQVTLQNADVPADSHDVNLKPAFDALGDRLAAIENRMQDRVENRLEALADAVARMDAQVATSTRSSQSQTNNATRDDVGGLAQTLLNIEERMLEMDGRLERFDRFNRDLECSLVASVRHLGAQMDNLAGHILEQSQVPTTQWMEASQGRQSEFLTRQVEQVSDVIANRMNDQAENFDSKLAGLMNSIAQLGAATKQPDPSLKTLVTRFDTLEADLATTLAGFLDQADGESANQNDQTAILRELSLHISKLAEDQKGVRGEANSLDARTARMERQLVELARQMKAELDGRNKSNVAAEGAARLEQVMDRLDDNITNFTSKADELCERQADEQELRIARLSHENTPEKEALTRTNASLNVVLERLNGDCDRFANSVDQINQLDMASIMQGAAEQALATLPPAETAKPDDLFPMALDGSELSRFEQAVSVMGEMVGRIEPTVKTAIDQCLTDAGAKVSSEENMASLSETLLHSISQINLISTDVNELIHELKTSHGENDPATLQKLNELSEVTRQHADRMVDVAAAFQSSFEPIAKVISQQAQESKPSHPQW
ncbi:MAG: hypothetical protein AAF141_11930 [Pseudomonadota bacterium]